LPELAGKNKELLQRAFQQRPREPLHLDPLERREFLGGVRESVDHSKPVWVWLNQIARYWEDKLAHPLCKVGITRAEWEDSERK
jgi:hypothetical protein